MNLADCYRLLGLPTTASYEAVKASYRRLARQYHPDANPSNPQQAHEKFIQLTEAYRLLISTLETLDQRSQEPTARTASSPAAPPSTPHPPTPPVGIRPIPKDPPQDPFDLDLPPTDRRLKQECYEQLQQLLREQRFPRAIALVEGLAQRLPRDIEVRQWQAITYQRFGRSLVAVQEFDKARSYLQKALRTDPNNKSLWYEVERDMRRIDQVEIF
jgi:curved DNA-binding protein CbpA